LEVADFLRANGVAVTPDRDLFADRRRSKNENELRGIRNAQKACEAALDRARDLMRRAEANGAGLEADGEPLTSERLKQEFELVCRIFEDAGYKTVLSRQPGEVQEDGFIHGLGHGVGLEVHEQPLMGRTGHDFVPGDVITIEPGLYRAGYGGLRLEDLVLVT